MGSFAVILYITSDIFVCIHIVCMNTFSIGCRQHVIEADRMCDSVNDSMMVMVIVTERRQLNILMKYYVYKNLKKHILKFYPCLC